MANNGVHALDLRWGLESICPAASPTVERAIILMTIRKRRTPGWPRLTLVTAARCGTRVVATGAGEVPPFVAFYGEGGVLSCTTGNNFTIHDLNGKELETKTAPGNDAPHFNNFVNAIRTGKN